MLIDKLLDINNNVNFDEALKIEEFQKCAECEHKSKWHLEGNVFEHIKLVCSSLNSLLSSKNISDSKRKVLMTAALFHDIGKPLAMKEKPNGSRSFIGHENYSEKIARCLLWDEEFYFREEVCSLVRNHMIPLRLYQDNNKKRKIMMLSHDVNSIEDLILLKKADCLGQITNENDEWEKKLKNLEENSKKLDCYNHPYNFFNGYTKFNFLNNDVKANHPTIVTNSNSFNVYIMVGLPGAGKNTYINTHFSNLPVVSRDEIRLTINNEHEKTIFNKNLEKIVNNIEDSMITELAESQKSFVINNLNLKRKYRQHYINILSKYKPNVYIVYVQAPSLSDNIKRREGLISKEVIAQMRYSFDFPLPYEYVGMTYNIQK